MDEEKYIDKCHCEFIDLSSSYSLPFKPIQTQVVWLNQDKRNSIDWFQVLFWEEKTKKKSYDAKR